jgi:hypothetical protein
VSSRRDALPRRLSLRDPILDVRMFDLLHRTTSLRDVGFASVRFRVDCSSIEPRSWRRAITQTR